MQTAPSWNRSIVALLVSVFCNASAAMVGVLSVGVQVYELTRQELHLGLLGLAEFAPAALLVLVTGSVADRFDRARVGFLGSAAQAAAGVGLAAYASTDPTAVLPIFAIVLLFGAGRAFYAPSSRALPADIVAPSVLPWLTARRAATWQAAIIIGPVAAGFLYAIHPVVPFVAMAVLHSTAAAAMLVVRASTPSLRAETQPAIHAGVETLVDHAEATPTPRARLSEAFEGLRFIRRSPILLAAISLDLFAVLFGGAVALLPAIATDRLGVGPVGLGWLRAAGGIGAAMTTVLIARRPITRHVGRVLLCAVGVFGVFTILLGLTRVYAVAFIAMAALTGADAISVFIRSTLVPLITPSNRRGRVLAVESVFIGASNELGAFESGVAGQLLGASGAVVLGGAATLAVAAVYWVRFPVLRNVDRFPESGSEDPATLARNDPHSTNAEGSVPSEGQEAATHGPSHTETAEREGSSPSGGAATTPTTFVPADFVVPDHLRCERFVLVPLAAEHNERDHEAWMSSIDHIRATPGFAQRSWPRPMTLEENARDIRKHADDFAARSGFTYTVLSPDGTEVIGCVYIYPGAEDGIVDVRSWVRASHAHLDVELYIAVRDWLEADWPFTRVNYAPRS